MDQPAYRRPAWPGLLPARPIYAPAPADVADAIASALATTAPVVALKNAGGSSPTFRVDVDEAPLFVKLVTPERWSELREAEAIARWLVEHGAPAIAARDGHPPQLTSGDFVVVYPFADGRPPSPATDAGTVGIGIGRIHAALKSHPGVAGWQDRTDARMDRLVSVRAMLARGEIAAGPRPEQLRILAADRSISFLPGAHGSGPSRPLHGDLNIFNIVVDHGDARFIDFEDVVHSVLPAEHDVALACERVILVQEPDATAAAAAIDRLLEGYAAGGGDAINRKALPGVLLGLSLRSLCTLALIDRSGHDAEEWTKFFTLIEAAERRRDVIA